MQSDTKLWAHSDASYLYVVGEKSRADAVFYLDQKWSTPSKNIFLRCKLSGFVHVICKIIRHVVCSAVEAEIAAVFITV